MEEIACTKYRLTQGTDSSGYSFRKRYRMTQKKRGLLKNPTKIEEIQEKKFIDRN
jgi:hypothetical protein